MNRIRSYESVDRLIELARTYCAERAAYRDAVRDGRLSPAREKECANRLQRMDERIQRLKRSDEPTLARSRKSSNVIPMTAMPNTGRKAAR